MGFLMGLKKHFKGLFTNFFRTGSGKVNIMPARSNPGAPSGRGQKETCADYQALILSNGEMGVGRRELGDGSTASIHCGCRIPIRQCVAFGLAMLSGGSESARQHGDLRLPVRIQPVRGLEVRSGSYWIRTSDLCSVKAAL